MQTNECCRFWVQFLVNAITGLVGVFFTLGFGFGPCDYAWCCTHHSCWGNIRWKLIFNSLSISSACWLDTLATSGLSISVMQMCEVLVAFLMVLGPFATSMFVWFSDVYLFEIGMGTMGLYVGKYMHFMFFLRFWQEIIVVCCCFS